MSKQVLKAVAIEAHPSDDEGLASLFCSLEDGSYFTLCRQDDDQTAYLEHGDQSTAVYSNKVTYELNTDGISFSLGASAATRLKLPKQFKVVWPKGKAVSAKVKKALEKILPKGMT